MTSHSDPAGLEQPRGPGCLRSAAGLAVLAVLGPPVAALRSLRRWRRGRRVQSSRGRAACGDLVRFEVILDVPVGQERQVLDRLTDALVRVAERLHVSDTVLHALYRRAGDSELEAVPVGPRLHDLGERFSLLMAHNRLERRTMVWLALPAATHLASVVDTTAADPEGDGEPDGLVRRAGPRWAAASSFARGRASLEYRLVVYVAEGEARAVEEVLDRLCDEVAMEHAG